MKCMTVALVTRDYCVGVLTVSLDEEDTLTEGNFVWQGGYEASGPTVRVFFTRNDGEPITVLNGTEWRHLEDNAITDWFYRMIFDGDLAEARVDLARMITAAQRERR